MGKSVTEYYAEKMQKLMEAQKQSASAPRVAPKLTHAPNLQNGADKHRDGTAQGQKQKVSAQRGYYDSFRASKTMHTEASRASTVLSAPQRSVRSGVQNGQAVRQNPPAVSRASDARGAQSTDRQYKQRPPQTGGGLYTPPRASVSGGTESRQQGKHRPSPEQTVEDMSRERAAQKEALQKARRGRRLRKIRDALISFVLIVAVFVVMCVVVYRLLFVVSDISVSGNEAYTEDDIINVSGVAAGDHLYSFRASLTGSNIIHRCPLVESVEVDRKAPNTVTFNVTETQCTYYADFYGELRAMSSSLRVLYSVSADEAREQKLILIKLPAVKSAVAGEKIEFADIRSDEYIYETAASVAASELAERIGMIDVRSKYDIKLVCDGKYLLTLGDSSVMNTKLRIASSVLKDEMFSGDDKARIDLSDTSQTSVVIDNQLELD